jgi:hypothetical protein
MTHYNDNDRFNPGAVIAFVCGASRQSARLTIISLHFLVIEPIEGPGCSNAIFDPHQLAPL